MDEIISLIVANGLWAVLFCTLLFYQLRDSRSRETKYTQTIRALSERLDVVTSVKADTTDIKADTTELVVGTGKLAADTAAVKKAVVGVDGKGSKKCANATA